VDYFRCVRLTQLVWAAGSEYGGGPQKMTRTVRTLQTGSSGEFTERRSQRLRLGVDLIQWSQLYSYLSGVLAENCTYMRLHWRSQGRRSFLFIQKSCTNPWKTLTYSPQRMALFATGLPGNPADSICVVSHREHTVFCISRADCCSPLVGPLRHQCIHHPQLVLLQVIGLMVRQL
jgi:hypothetical protein